MLRRKKTKLLILGIMTMLSISGCSAKNEKQNEIPKESSAIESNSHYPITITTYNYKKEPVKLTFNEAPKKVVAVYQNSIETMLALGLGDKIVFAAGLDHDVADEYKEEFKKINYSNEFTPSKESVLMSQPDFILSWYSLFDDKKLGDIDYWNNNGTNTYMSLNSGISENKTIENEINDILNLGKIFNVEDRAKELVDEINESIAKVEKETIKEDKPSTIIVEIYDDKIANYGKNQLAGDMVTKLNGNLVNPEGKTVSAEDLIKLNPDTIFVSYMDRGSENIEKQEVDKILNNKALQSLNAVKNKRVYGIPLGNMYSSGIRTVDGIKDFANGLYPDLNIGE